MCGWVVYRGGSLHKALLYAVCVYKYNFNNIQLKHTFGAMYVTTYVIEPQFQ